MEASSRKPVKEPAQADPPANDETMSTRTPPRTQSPTSAAMRGWCAISIRGGHGNRLLIREYVNRRLRTGWERNRRLRSRLPSAFTQEYLHDTSALPHSETPRRPAESGNLIGRVKAGSRNRHVQFDEQRLEKRGYGANCDTGTGESCRKQQKPPP